MEAIKNFLTKETTIAGGFSVQTWMFIAVALAIVLIAIIIASAVKNSKKTAEKTEEAPAPQVRESYIPDDDEDETEDSAAAINVVASDEKADEKTEYTEEAVEQAEYAEEKVEEETAAEASEADAEKIMEDSAEQNAAADAKPDEAAEEEKAAEENEETEEVVVKEAPAAPKAAAKKPAPKRTEKPVVKEEKAEAADEAAADEVAATVEDASKEKKTVGKFELCNSVGGYRYMLLANNGQLLYESRDYKSIDNCRDAVGKFVNAVAAGQFKINADKFGNYKFNLKSPTSHNVVYVGESYGQKKACLNIVESVKHFAPVSPIVDITEADYVANAVVFEIPQEVRDAVDAGQGATGKWEIAPSEPENAKSPFVYLLYANNGQLLYESREYKSADSCKSGLETFVKTVKDGVFIVDEDKFGRYKFILRSRKAGSQAEYVGQNYSDKSACMSSAVSVYKFALLTPFSE